MLLTRLRLFSLFLATCFSFRNSLSLPLASSRFFLFPSLRLSCNGILFQGITLFPSYIHTYCTYATFLDLF